MQDTVVRKYTIRLSSGVHVRTALTIAKLAEKFESKLFISKGGQEVIFDSPLGLLTLGIIEGDEIAVRVEGPDSLELADAFDKLVDDNFGE
ncbi:HPr family phosphocarrier protein [bacterium]|nr:HPr family phosphocarrier protein [bacterium]MBU4134137.1 HPr family phosphocarrier protein [bacterium]